MLMSGQSGAMTTVYKKMFLRQQLDSSSRRLSWWYGNEMGQRNLGIKNTRDPRLSKDDRGCLKMCQRNLGIKHQRFLMRDDGG